ncbi:MAG: hypothetical protein ACOX1I_08710 [Dethiobacteria bacterium]
MGNKPCQAEGQRGLAATAGAGDCKELSRVYLQVDLFQRRKNRPAVCKRKVLNINDRFQYK